jgi:hypothetical protein
MSLELRCRGRLPRGNVIAIAGAQGHCRLVSALAIGVVAAGLSVGVWAHGDGEEHAGEPMQAQATGVRLAAQSHDFELVAVAQGNAAGAE